MPQKRPVAKATKYQLRDAAERLYAVVRTEAGDWRVVRLADAARFVYTCPASGHVTRSWSGNDAAAWVQVLHNPRFTDRITQEGGAWEPAARADARCVPDEPEHEGDFDTDEADTEEACASN